MEEKLKQEILELLKTHGFQDSVSIGNSKTGEVKVYCDFSNVEEAEKKLLNAIGLLKKHRVEVFGGD